VRGLRPGEHAVGRYRRVDRLRGFADGVSTGHPVVTPRVTGGGARGFSRPIRSSAGATDPELHAYVARTLGHVTARADPDQRSGRFPSRSGNGGDLAGRVAAFRGVHGRRHGFGFDVLPSPSRRGAGTPALRGEIIRTFWRAV